MTRDELQALWHAESASPPGKGAEEMLNLVIAKSRGFRRRIAIRNGLEVAAALVVVVLFAWAAFRMPSALERIGAAVVAASALWIIFYLLHFGSAAPPDPNLDLSAYGRHLAENYDRQIRLLRNVKYWYLLPPYLGLLLSAIGQWQRFSAAGRNPAPILFGFGFATLVFALIWILNEVYGVRCIRRLKKELSSVAARSEL